MKSLSLHLHQVSPILVYICLFPGLEKELGLRAGIARAGDPSLVPTTHIIRCCITVYTHFHLSCVLRLYPEQEKDRREHSFKIIKDNNEIPHFSSIEMKLQCQMAPYSDNAQKPGKQTSAHSLPPAVHVG